MSNSILGPDFAFLFNYLSENNKLYLNTIYILNRNKKQIRTS
jgi:hypothetical protein